MSRKKTLTDLEAAMRIDPELAEEARRYTHREWESAAAIIAALETINPAYSTPEAVAWLSYCYDVLATVQEKDRGEDMTAEEWELLGPAMEQALRGAPPGLSWEQLIEDLNAAEDKVKRTA